MNKNWKVVWSELQIGDRDRPGDRDKFVTKKKRFVTYKEAFNFWSEKLGNENSFSSKFEPYIVEITEKRLGKSL